jgi:hypothetical protein
MRHYPLSTEAGRKRSPMRHFPIYHASPYMDHGCDLAPGEDTLAVRRWARPRALVATVVDTRVERTLAARADGPDKAAAPQDSHKADRHSRSASRSEEADGGCTRRVAARTATAGSSSAGSSSAGSSSAGSSAAWTLAGRPRVRVTSSSHSSVAGAAAGAPQPPPRLGGAWPMAVLRHRDTRVHTLRCDVARAPRIAPFALQAR